MSSDEDFSMTDSAWAFAGRHGGDEEGINLSIAVLVGSGMKIWYGGLPFVFLGGARQQDFISGAPEIMSSGGPKYYPLCGFDCLQVLNKRHVRKHGFDKADNFGFEEQAQI